MVQLLCRRTIGNKIVSRIPSPVNAINNRSMPIPVPVVGGIAYSIAARKSSSSSHRLVVAGGRGACLGREPFPLDHRVDEFGISRGQLEAAHVQVPFLRDSGHAAVSRVSGEVSTGKSRTNVGAYKLSPTVYSQSSSTSFPWP